MQDEIEKMARILRRFPLIKNLIDSIDDNNDLNEELFTQSVINLMVQVGKIGDAAGYKQPSNAPFSKSNPQLILTEIESMLKSVCILVRYAQLLILEEWEETK